MREKKWMVKLVLLVTALLVFAAGCTYDENDERVETVDSKISLTAYASNEQDPQDVAENAIDGNPSTMWHTQWWDAIPLPQSITIVISEPVSVSELRYLPRQDFHDWGDPQMNGTITEYEIHSSVDGVNFDVIAEGVWEWDEDNRDWKIVNFAPKEATHIRLVAFEGAGGFASAAEIELGYDRI